MLDSKDPVSLQDSPNPIPPIQSILEVYIQFINSDLLNTWHANCILKVIIHFTLCLDFFLQVSLKITYYNFVNQTFLLIWNFSNKKKKKTTIIVTLFSTFHRLVIKCTLFVQFSWWSLNSFYCPFSRTFRNIVFPALLLK